MAGGLLALLLTTNCADAADEQSLDDAFVKRIQPIVDKHCLRCHRGDKAEAMLDLSQFRSTADIVKKHATWQEIRHRVAHSEMPPADEPQPTAAEKQSLVEWIDAFRKREAEQRAGDPGYVPVRRLNNSELNYTVRDLTGVDIQPAREFPVDPANEAGFDNSADSLTMTPALLTKSLAAARTVAEHMVLTPNGIRFAPHPVVTETDRDKYCVKRIVEFYKRQPTDLADYFFAAWKIKVAPQQYTLTSESRRLSAKYLKQIQALLSDKPVFTAEIESSEKSADRMGLGPLAVLRRKWLDLPTTIEEAPSAEEACRKMRDFVVDLRRRLEPEIEDFRVRGIHKGAQPFVLWKNDQYAAYRQRPFMPSIRKLSPGAESLAIADALSLPDDSSPDAGKRREQFESEVHKFCRIFPDAFYISERGRDYVGKPKAEQEKGRLLSAGFHSMMGYYRDDEPLMRLILDAAQQDQLDRLWQELDFVTSAPMRQYSGFVWFERTDSTTMRGEEFDFARAEDKSVTTPAMIERLAETYLAKADELGAGEEPRAAIETYFRRINSQIQWVEKTRLAAEPHHVNAMLGLAAKAFRRPLTESESAGLRSFYERLRSQDKLSHEEAMQDLLVSILMSPSFNFRVDLASRNEARSVMSDIDLASRLSYFLWSSMPDDELMSVATSGRLHEPEELRRQVERMLRDARIRGLATEFGGQWLDFRRFEQHNSVDRERFPSFDDQLRSSMFQEPVVFLEQMARRDRSVLDCIYADYQIIDETLASHYGVLKNEADRAEFHRQQQSMRMHPGVRYLPQSVVVDY